MPGGGQPCQLASRTYDFRPLVLLVGRGQTLMRPPIVSTAQTAFSLGENGQVARETSCIYQITREAQLASAPPDWRLYLVRVWAPLRRTTDAALPRTRQALYGRGGDGTSAGPCAAERAARDCGDVSTASGRPDSAGGGGDRRQAGRLLP
jgi:hypothetical protein